MPTRYNCKYDLRTPRLRSHNACTKTLRRPCHDQTRLYQQARPASPETPDDRLPGRFQNRPGARIALLYRLQTPHISQSQNLPRTLRPVKPRSLFPQGTPRWKATRRQNHSSPSRQGRLFRTAGRGVALTTMPTRSTGFTPAAARDMASGQ